MERKGNNIAEEPYLFLELDQGGMNDIYKKQSVRLRVKIKNYISHK